MTLFKQKHVYHLRLFIAYSFTITVQIPKDFIKSELMRQSQVTKICTICLT